MPKPAKSSKQRLLTDDEAAHLMRQALVAGESTTISGVEFPVDWKVPAGTFRGITLNDVSCEAPRLAGGLWRRLKVVDSRFTDVIVEGVRCNNVEFDSCQFERVRLGKRLRGRCEDVVVNGCRANDCRVEAMAFVNASLTNCDIKEIAWRDVQWQQGSWTKVRLSGRINRAQFLGCTIVDCDFSEAHLSESAFVDCKMTNLKMPAREDNFVVEAPSLMEIGGPLWAALSDDGLMAYRTQADILSRIRGPVVIEEALWGTLDKPSRQTVMKALFNARIAVIK